MAWGRPFFVVLGLLGLAGCGFHPLYGEKTSLETPPARAVQLLAAVEVAPIPDRTGQVLRNALLDRFHGDHGAETERYRLVLSPISEVKTNLDITTYDETTRTQLRLSTQMTLTDLETGKVLLDRGLYSLGSYNVLTSEFTTQVSEDRARLNLLEDLARQVETQVLLSFSAPDPS